MSPEDRIAAYNDAVQVLNNYTAQEAAKVGNSQRSIGGLAEAVANPSGQTSGLANYTYNRTIRPTIDTLAANLTTTGLSQGLSKQLYDALQAAKSNYEDAKNRYTVASTAPKTTTPSNNQTFTEDATTEYTVTKGPVPDRGTILGVGTSGNGQYVVTVADGQGGSNNYKYLAGSGDEARNKYIVEHGRDSDVGRQALNSLISGTQYDQPMIRRMLGLE